MNKRLIGFTIAIGIALVFTFQNCAQNSFGTKSVNDGSVIFTPSTAEDVGKNSSSRSGTGTTASSSTNTGATVPASVACEARTVEWTVNGQRCSASSPRMTTSNPEVILYDALAPVTGSVTVNCSSSGQLSINGSKAQSCTAAQVVDPNPTPQRQVRSYKSEYTVGDPYAIVYTSVTVTEVIYACYQSTDDGTYPCINGNIAARYQEVPRPPSPGSADQELIWTSPFFFAAAGVDFTDYEVIFMRKNANGQLTDVVGSTRFGFRLPADVLSSSTSGSFTSTSGSNVFSFSCGSAPSGYRQYRYFSGKDCYYKIN